MFEQRADTVNRILRDLRQQFKALAENAAPCVPVMF